jgi:hypothetical protein
VQGEDASNSKEVEWQNGDQSLYTDEMDNKNSTHSNEQHITL